MIDCEFLLYGNPSWEEVVWFFKSQLPTNEFVGLSGDRQRKS